MESDITICLSDDLVTTETHLNSEYISIGSPTIGGAANRIAPIQIRNTSVIGKPFNHSDKYKTTFDITDVHTFINKSYVYDDGSFSFLRVESLCHIDSSTSRILSNMTYIVGPKNVVDDNIINILVDKKYLTINTDGSLIFDQTIDANSAEQMIPSWDKYIQYQSGDIVRLNGAVYKYNTAVASGSIEIPGSITNSLVWSTLISIWSSAASYTNVVNNVGPLTPQTVYYNGEYYLYIKSSNGNLNTGETGPNNSTNWSLRSTNGSIDVSDMSKSYIKNQIVTSIFYNANGVISSFCMYKNIKTGTNDHYPTENVSDGTYWVMIGNMPISSNYNKTVIGLNRRLKRFNDPTNLDTSININVSDLYTLGTLGKKSQFLSDGTFQIDTNIQFNNANKIIFDKYTGYVWDISSPDVTYTTWSVSMASDFLQNIDSVLFSIKVPIYRSSISGDSKINQTYNITTLDIVKIKDFTSNGMIKFPINFTKDITFNCNINLSSIINGLAYISNTTNITFDKDTGYVWDMLTADTTTYNVLTHTAYQDWLQNVDGVVFSMKIPVATRHKYSPTHPTSVGHTTLNITTLDIVKIKDFTSNGVINFPTTFFNVINILDTINIADGDVNFNTISKLSGVPIFNINKNNLNAHWVDVGAGGYTNANDVIFRFKYENQLSSMSGPQDNKFFIDITVGHFIYLFNKYAADHPAAYSGTNYNGVFPYPIPNGGVNQW